MLEKKYKLREMATANRPSDILPSTKYSVRINGNDRTPMTPHFHFVAKNSDFHIEIAIEPKEELKIVNAKFRKGIHKKYWLTWNGLAKEKELLLSWYDKQSKVMPMITNYEAIRYIWNLENPENEIIF